MAHALRRPGPFLAVLSIAGLVGCFDATIPAAAALTCDESGSCPTDFRCAQALGICEFAVTFGALCGDGVQGVGEDCDEAADNNDARANACRTDCSAPRCGDGVVDDGEGCDDGPANSDTAPDACRTTCVVPTCGDATVDRLEECDEGDTNSDTLPNACRTSCARGFCGDAVVDDGEACDEGARNSDSSADACRLDCSTPRCGDNVIDADEDCDDGAANSDVVVDACREQCQPSSCGDGVVDSDEACDDADANADDVVDACRTDCSGPSCGDGVIDEGEGCDNGEANSDIEPNACRTSCRAARCGDGARDLDEACDDGVLNDDTLPGACRTTCDNAGCGDGVIDTDEACDDGNRRAGDGCASNCSKREICGDRIVDEGEVCDDGNGNPVDGCDACQPTIWDVRVVVGGSVEPRERLDVSLSQPPGIAVDAQGRVFVADAGSHRVLRSNDDGTLTVVAGQGTAGFSGDGQSAGGARLNSPSGLAVDDGGRLFIADTGNHRVRRVDLDGTITTVAGTGSAGFSGDGAPAVGAKVNSPRGVAVDGRGRLFIADSGNNRVRRVEVDGAISTIAGDGSGADPFFGAKGCRRSLFLDGDPLFGDVNPLATQIVAPRAVAVDATGQVFIAATGNGCVRRINLNGTLATVTNTLAPAGLALDGSGRLYVAIAGLHRVGRIFANDENGSIEFIAGTGSAGDGGDGGPATAALLNAPAGVAIDADGNLLITDTGNERVRRIAVADGIIETLVGSGRAGGVGDGGAATSALLADPAGVAVAADGTLFVADTAHHRIRRIDDDGVMSTVIGTGRAGNTGDGGSAALAELSLPSAVVVDQDGALVIADTGNKCIRRVRADDVVETVALGSAPRAVAIADDGAIFFADAGANTVRRIAPDGTLTTLAGTGIAGFTGDGGAATSAQLRSPGGLVMRGGELFIADTGNNRVRRISAQGTISTVAGGGAALGDGGAATAANLNGPRGLVFDVDGRLLIADTGRNRIRLVTIGGTITTVATTNAAVGLAIAGDGSVFIADTGLDRVVRLGDSPSSAPVAGLFHPTGPGALATARLYAPIALATIDSARVMAVGAEGRALGVDLDRGVVEVVVGSPAGQTTTGPAQLTSLFADASGVAFDPINGQLVIADQGAGALRIIDVDGDDDGIADDVDAWTSVGDISVRAPGGVAVDGNSFVVARDDAHCVVRVGRDGVQAATPVLGRCGVRGAGSLLDGPTHVAVSPSTGAIYVSDTNNHRVLRVAGGVVDVVIGDGSPSSAGEGGPARLFPVLTPRQLAIDAFGNLYVASARTVRVIANVDDDQDADGDDRVFTVYGGGDRVNFPERDSLCIGAIALGDDGSVFAADSCQGFMVQLVRRRVP
jgi:cysteine-rich repeat protein